MDSIQVLGKVTLKQVVTEEYKAKASAEFQGAIAKVDEELQMFDKDMQKTLTELTLKGHPQIEQLRRQFNMEREKIAIYKEQLLASVKNIADLEMGAVVDAGEGNYIQSLKVGDSFGGVVEILLENDVVKAINGREA